MEYKLFLDTNALLNLQKEAFKEPFVISQKTLEEVENIKTSGKKDNEDFWIKLGEQYVLIRYFAVRNSQGEYLGVLEVTQNIKPIQEITGEKRLMSD